jgi:hypothetical protein
LTADEELPRTLYAEYAGALLRVSVTVLRQADSQLAADAASARHTPRTLE